MSLLLTDQADRGVYHALGPGAECSEGARYVCLPGGGGDSVSTDSSAAGPQSGMTPLQCAVEDRRIPRSGGIAFMPTVRQTSTAQLLRQLGATE